MIQCNVRSRILISTSDILLLYRPQPFPPNHRTADGVRKASHLVVTPPDIFPAPDGVQDVRSARQDKSVKCRATTASSPLFVWRPHTPVPRVIESLIAWRCFPLICPPASCHFKWDGWRGFFFLLSIQEDAVMKYQTAVFFFVFFSFFAWNNRLSLCSVRSASPPEYQVFARGWLKERQRDPVIGKLAHIAEKQSRHWAAWTGCMKTLADGRRDILASCSSKVPAIQNSKLTSQLKKKCKFASGCKKETISRRTSRSLWLFEKGKKKKEEKKWIHSLKMCSRVNWMPSWETC